MRILASIPYRLIQKLGQVLTGIDLSCEVRVGRTYVIDHLGGRVISGYAMFGDDCIMNLVDDVALRAM